MEFETGHERHCFENATYFTAVRGRTPRQRIRREFKTYEEALSAATGDGRTMIYAVTADGLSAHIRNA